MANKSKTGKVLLILGIVFMLAAIGFFIASSAYSNEYNKFASIGIRSGLNQYAENCSRTAYCFLLAAIPFIVFGIKKLIKK